jgi:cryptochrome
MTDLSESYAKISPDGDGDQQRLWVVREAPATVMPKLFEILGVTHLVFEKDTDAYARKRDEMVIEMAEKAGVEVVVRSGRTLFDVDDVVKRHGGKPTMSMTQLKKATEGTEVRRPLERVESIPGCGDLIVDLKRIEDKQEVWDVEREEDMQRNVRSGEEKGFKVGLLGPKGDCAVPTLEEMGIEMGDAKGRHMGGETEALRLLKKIIDNEEYTATFEKPASAPTDFEPQSTTLLSPHHHFGSLSVRKFWWDVVQVFERRKKSGKKTAAEPMNLFGQLLFRDMYFVAQAAVGLQYAQTKGNPVARWIDWKLQSNYSENGLLDGSYNVDDAQAEEYFRRWREARTGFPWIDALMRQLKQEGWIHHLGRHAVACFLTRGGCYVHWERGAEVFEEWLIDHEVACNVGNWMW